MNRWPPLLLLGPAVSGINRRRLLKGSLAAAGAATLPCAPAVAQGAAPHLVVIGGGFGGAACARALKKADPKLHVTLVDPTFEAPLTYIAGPLSNSVIAGLRNLKLQRFSYDKIAADGIIVAARNARAIDPGARTVTLDTDGPLS